MSYKEILLKVQRQAQGLSKAAPELAQSFQRLMSVASKDGAIPARIKELIAVSIAICEKCEGCVVFHVQNAIRHGATREELVEAIGVAVEMGAGPAMVYGATALAAFDELKAQAA